MKRLLLSLFSLLALSTLGAAQSFPDIPPCAADTVQGLVASTGCTDIACVCANTGVIGQITVRANILCSIVDRDRAIAAVSSTCRSAGVASSISGLSSTTSATLSRSTTANARSSQTTSATSEAASSTTTAAHHSKGVSDGALAGIVVGSVIGAVVVFGILGCVCMCLRRRKRTRGETASIASSSADKDYGITDAYPHPMDSGYAFASTTRETDFVPTQHNAPDEHVGHSGYTSKFEPISPVNAISPFQMTVYPPPPRSGNVARKALPTIEAASTAVEEEEEKRHSSGLNYHPLPNRLSTFRPQPQTYDPLLERPNPSTSTSPPPATLSPTSLTVPPASRHSVNYYEDSEFPQR